MGLAPKKDEGDSAIRKEKLALFQGATTAHSQYSRDAASGAGVDRHFFGLVSLVDEDESAPCLYSNPVFNASKRWRLSTSNLSHPGIVNWGFGQVSDILAKCFFLSLLNLSGSYCIYCVG